MTTPSSRIPVPWPQRREQLRETLVPVACYAATLLACVWLWSRQSAAAPYAVGEVYGDVAEVRSPVTGTLLPLESEGTALSQFAEVQQGQPVASVQTIDETGQKGPTVTIDAPISGAVSLLVAKTGQTVLRGDVLLRLAATQPKYILCHVVNASDAIKSGREAWVRPRTRGAQWSKTTVEAAGPAIETAPAPPGTDVLLPTRGQPVRIALPDGVTLTPGATVDVRFSP